MVVRGSLGIGLIVWALAVISSAASAATTAPAAASEPLVEAALQNLMTLERPGQDGFANVWDGNKYVQCRRAADRSLRCEAGGALMQPSLARVLTPEKVARLASLGWRLDPNFGNYVRTFAAGTPLSQVAESLLQALVEGYDADVTDLTIETDWIASEPCPPRNGPSQNLAGLINDAPAMQATAVHDCAYIPTAEDGPLAPAATAADLIKLYQPRVTGEIQRLRVNLHRQIHVIFDAGIGYVQCAPETTPPAIYCEAQSAESWPALASILTPERVAQLHSLGFADPGRAPNYWKTYPLGGVSDDAIAQELLTILHEVYGYTGTPALKVATEKGDE